MIGRPPGSKNKKKKKAKKTTKTAKKPKTKKVEEMFENFESPAPRPVIINDKPIPKGLQMFDEDVEILNSYTPEKPVKETVPVVDKPATKKKGKKSEEPEEQIDPIEADFLKLKQLIENPKLLVVHALSHLNFVDSRTAMDMERMGLAVRVGEDTWTWNKEALMRISTEVIIQLYNRVLYQKVSIRR